MGSGWPIDGSPIAIGPPAVGGTGFAGRLGMGDGRAGTGSPVCPGFSGKQVETGNWDRQRTRWEAEARQRHGTGIATVTEQASGLNERRRGLQKLLTLAATGALDVVLVEFRGRWARCGFPYLGPPFAA